jgi:hypothetical protein
MLYPAYVVGNMLPLFFNRKPPDSKPAPTCRTNLPHATRRQQDLARDPC